MTPTLTLLLLALLAAGPGVGPGVGPGAEPAAEPAPPDLARARRLVEALVDADEPARREAYEALLEGGADAAAAAAEGLRGAPLEARRARARVLRRTGGEAELESALEALEDPDALVREELARFVGRGDLAELGAERVAALSSAAATDPHEDVRAAARRGLDRVAHPDALPALGALAPRLPAAEAADACRLLASNPRGRAVVVEAVRSRFGSAPSPLRDEALAVLLAAYGEALAERPGGGIAPADRAPFVLGARHPHGAVRRAARTALEGFLERARSLGRDARSIELLEALAGEGLDPLELHYRRAHLVLTRGGDPAQARDSAAALLRAVPADAPPAQRVFRVYAHLFRAAAALAEGRPEDARGPLEAGVRIVDGLRSERIELRPHLGAPSELEGALAVDLELLRGVAELVRVCALLAEGRDAEDAEVLERARTAHVQALRAQRLQVRTGAPVAAGRWDALLDQDLSPFVLLLATGRGSGSLLAGRIDLAQELGRALAAVAPLELPGFEPVEGLEPRLAEPLEDPERRELHEDVLLAELELWTRRRLELEEQRRARGAVPEAAVREIEMRLFQVRRDLQRAAGGEDEPLRTLRLPSDLAWNLARERLAVGDPAGARALARRALDDLEAAELWERYYWKQRLAARLEVALGASYTDDGEPLEAEERYQRALARYEGLENTYARRLEESADDPEQRAAYEAQVRRSRLDQSDVLVSLAVNANVRLRDPDKALRYFERAFALQQNPFMRVLLACYRARSGREAEARAELRSVVVTPGLYYNLACTHALLGDTDVALDYLAREFTENHPSEESRERQKAWAAEDPDLEPLRDDPRFRRLVAPD